MNVIIEPKLAHNPKDVFSSYGLTLLTLATLICFTGHEADVLRDTFRSSFPNLVSWSRFLHTLRSSSTSVTLGVTSNVMVLPFGVEIKMDEAGGDKSLKVIMASICDADSVNLVSASEIVVMGRTISIFSKMSPTTVDDVSTGVVKATSVRTTSVCRESTPTALIAITEV